MNSSFIRFFTLLRVVPKIKTKDFSICLHYGNKHGVYSYPLLAVWNPARHHVHKIQSKVVLKEDRSLVSVAILRPCTTFSCAMACQKEAGCVVFRLNEARAKCFLSRRPDNDSANQEISHSELPIIQVTVLVDCCL